MRFIFIILTMLYYLNSAFGAEAKPEDELTFLKGASKYINDSTKILRPLKEFKVGKKYCLWGTKNWDEACQDAAMKYAFGPEWKEFKRVVIDFIELNKKNDPIGVSKLFQYPLNINRSTRVHDDGSIGYAQDEVANADSFVENSQHFLGDSLANTSYKKILIHDLWQYGFYTITLTTNHIVIFFNNMCENHPVNNECYVPLITLLQY